MSNSLFNIGVNTKCEYGQNKPFTFDKACHNLYDKASLGICQWYGHYKTLFLMFMVMIWYTNYLYID